MKFWVTTFVDLFARTLSAEDMTLEELAELIKNTSAPTKSGLPCLKLARFGAVRTPAPANCLRHDGNVLMTSGIEIDHDAETMDLDEAVRRLDGAGIGYLLHTSPSNGVVAPPHSAGGPRWRGILPTSKELPPGERARLVDRVNGLLGGVLAKESWGISQSFHYGRIGGVPFDLVYNDVEECIDDADELDETALPFQAAVGAKPGTTGGAGAKPNYQGLDEPALYDLIKSKQSYFRAGCELLRRWAEQGVSQADATVNLAAALDAVPPASRDRKWHSARARIPKWVARIYAFVAKVAAKARKAKGQGRPLEFTKPAPWPTPVDGAELLDELIATLTTYVVMSEAAKHAVVLWIIHTYVFTAAMITPRLEIKSAQKRCGKTTLLTIIGAVAARPLGTANISAPAVYRTVELVQPTLLVDEADSFVSENEELRGVLNAGYMRGGQVIRVVGDDHEPRVFSCWSPVAIATIRKLPDTIEDRAIAIMLQRRLKGEPITRLRLDRLTQLVPLTSKLQRWADDNIEEITAADPDVPDELNDRSVDCWRILLSIADRIGGHWPKRAREAATALSVDNDIETRGTRLLADLRDLFDAESANDFDPKINRPVNDRKNGELFSGEIVEALALMEDRPWPEWKGGKPITKVQLARLLAHFKIRPKDIRRGNLVRKGYAREQLEDLFERYLT